MTQEQVVDTFNRRFPAYAGYSEEELGKLGDLSQLSMKQLQELMSKVDAVARVERQGPPVTNDRQFVIKMNWKA